MNDGYTTWGVYNYEYYALEVLERLRQEQPLTEPRIESRPEGFTIIYRSMEATWNRKEAQT